MKLYGIHCSASIRSNALWTNVLAFVQVTEKQQVDDLSIHKQLM